VTTAACARGACAAAGVTHGVSAVLTSGQTVCATSPITALAPRTGVRAKGRAALPAGNGVLPVREGDVSARGVIVLENLANEEKEIAEATGLQRSPDGGSASAFAQALVLHVGMDHAVRLARTTGHLSLDFVGTALADPIPVEHNPKVSEVHVFQRDRIGPDAHGARSQIQLDLGKLGFQGE